MAETKGKQAFSYINRTGKAGASNRVAGENFQAVEVDWVWAKITREDKRNRVALVPKIALEINPTGIKTIIRFFYSKINGKEQENFKNNRSWPSFAPDQQKNDDNFRNEGGWWLCRKKNTIKINIRSTTSEERYTQTRCRVSQIFTKFILVTCH